MVGTSNLGSWHGHWFKRSCFSCVEQKTDMNEHGRSFMIYDFATSITIHKYTVYIRLALWKIHMNGVFLTDDTWLGITITTAWYVPRAFRIWRPNQKPKQKISTKIAWLPSGYLLHSHGIDGLPFLKMGIFHGYVSHNQMVVLTGRTFRCFMNAEWWECGAPFTRLLHQYVPSPGLNFFIDWWYNPLFLYLIYLDINRL
jgi:hypothetical protein